ncbi:PspC domain-containing protein [Streptomyces sp. NPDC001404]|uniref:PspC domain-containing protein n=1 Tax=Streptomyces sp. NPDC001404 TaxID=3364571 RepID=UPI003698E235
MTDEAPPADRHDGRPPLRRSREPKLISGVCGGLARYFDLDPVVFRVVLGVLAVTGGLGLILYGFAWLLIPLEGEEENEARRMLSGRVEGPALTAVLCALVGCGLFLSMLNNGGVLAFGLMLLIALSGAAYWSQRRRLAEAEEAVPDAAGSQKPFKAPKTVEAPPETQAPPMAGTPSWWRDPLARDVMAATRIGTGYLWGPDEGTGAAGAAPTGVAGTVRTAVENAWGAAVEHARPARRAPRLGGWTFLLALAAGWAGTAVHWHQQPLGTSLETGLACALGVFGLGIVLSSFYGRTGGGTVFLGVLTAVLLTGAAALPKSVTPDWTHITWHPASAADVQSRYAVGSGVGVLDLSGLHPPDGQGGQPVSAGAEVGAGRLKAVLPDDMTTQLTIEVGVGDIQLPGEGRDDIEIRPGQHRKVTLAPVAGHPSRGTLELRLKAGIGQVEVTRGTP